MFQCILREEGMSNNYLQKGELLKSLGTIVLTYFYPVCSLLSLVYITYET